MLPAGMSAASLFCDMDMAGMNSGVHSCCNFHGSDLSDAVTKDKEACTYQEVCPHILANEQTDVQAIPQISKEIIVAALSDELFTLSEDKQQSTHYKAETTSAKHSPPIFLLNSTFLN